jgi:hypothetical protein
MAFGKSDEHKLDRDIDKCPQRIFDFVVDQLGSATISSLFRRRSSSWRLVLDEESAITMVA